MNDTIATIFIAFLWVLLIALIVRALLSWFPGAQRSEFSRVLHQFTEPLLEPVRRIMPRTGFIDLSTTVVIVLLYIMIQVVQRAADS
ncbi:MAG TPA: YggT family protein [Tepidiformaceae bacterium]|nr:YggT family protein [Tepidiformaceae bacterium]